jgi:hypothetical protein
MYYKTIIMAALLPKAERQKELEGWKNLLYNVAYLFKARDVKPAETAFAKERLS